MFFFLLAQQDITAQSVSLTTILLILAIIALIVFIFRNVRR